MKKTFLPFFLLLFLAASPRAETVTIGTTSIAYEAPQGFARTDTLFPVKLEELDEEFGMHTVVFAKYVPAAHLEARKADSEALPDWYIQLAYDENFSKLPLVRPGFIVVTALVDKVIAREYASDAFIGKLENVFSGAIGRKLTITGMTQKGFVEKKGKTHSMLATGYAVIEGKSGPLDFPIGSMTTFILEQYKLITMIQIGRIGSDADLPAFTQQALDRASRMFPSSD
jgi:hypothetical protein